MIIYALLAVLLWPGRRDSGRALRRRPVRRAGRGPGAVAGAVGQPGIPGAAPGDPGAEGARRHGLRDGVRTARGRLASIDNHLAAFLTSHGPAIAVTLAIVLALVAASVYLPGLSRRAGVVLAIVTAAFIWIAEGLGGMLTGGGTDPNSGPLLALVAVAYWPLASAVLSAPGQPELVATAQPVSPEGA